MELFNAYQDDFGKITVVVSRRYYGGVTGDFYLSDPSGRMHPCLIRRREDRDNEVIYELSAHADLDIGTAYFLYERNGKKTPLQMRHIVQRDKFDEYYAYDGDDLGAVYHRTYTDFALWAPTAVSVTLQLKGKDREVSQIMTRTDRGVFRGRVYGDQKYSTYYYLVERNGEIVRTPDPYALSSTANGRESAVIDLSEVLSIPDPSVSLKLNSAADAVIYEANVRDMTSNKRTGTTLNGKYLSLTEAGTSLNGFPTGLDYLSSLGVTHVQFMPCADFATVNELHPELNYNWGYDPYNMLVPEGSYASDPNDPYARMKELRMMVAALHSRGIRVVYDVVFNHMYDVNDNPLELTVPYYYFRYSESGYLSNGSFCGNDLESRRRMTRKLFRKIIRTWTEVYGADGFRFDLMGILDTDTMNELYDLLHKIKPDGLIYGEGWNLPTALPYEQKAMIENQTKMPNIGHFNDVFRDVLKGATSDDGKYYQGFLTGNRNMAFDACSAMLGHSVKGPFFWRFDEPVQSINGVETHDNLTAWDKMHACCANEPREVRIMRQKMMIACTLFAQGVPFLHAGIEFAGTKNDNSNSYNAGDEINSMNWDRLALNREIYDYTKHCITIRRSEPLFRLDTAEKIRGHVMINVVDDGVLRYDLYDDHHQLRVIINGSDRDYQAEVSEGWTILCDEKGLMHDDIVHAVTVGRLTVVILKKQVGK